MCGGYVEEFRSKLLKDKVIDYTVEPGMSICGLIDAFRGAHGFMAGHVVKAVDLLVEMLGGNVLKILSFTGNLAATGLRGVFAQMIREGYFDLVITTCGTIDHDIARGTGHHYYRGDWFTDDSILKDLEIHRLGNIYIPVENYGRAVEKFTYSLLDELVKVKKEWSVYELLFEAGKRINDQNSILRAAYERNVPVFVPGIFDGAFGTNLVLHSQFSGLKINLMLDEKKLSDLVFTAEKLGALIIGGGISKHHTIWWAQFREGLDYAVYLTTAVEYDGSLSGAHPREAISWGKIKPSAKHVVVYGDATITLPLIFAGIKCWRNSVEE